MKTILIPIDFSETSANAADYAIKFATQINACILFLHVFHIPVIASDVPVIVPSYTQLEDDSMVLLKKFGEELCEKNNFTQPVEYIVNPGFVVDEINEVTTNKKVDLIVMGIKGSGKISELLIGSSSTGVMRTVNCPTIIVPLGANYKPIKTIVFACDLESETTNGSNTLQQVEKFVQLFNCKVMVLNIVGASEKPSLEKAISGVKFEKVFEHTDHSLHFPEEDDLTFAINNFADQHQADLVIMIPHKHNLLTRIFSESNTKKMAFHTHTPLVSIR